MDAGLLRYLGIPKICWDTSASRAAAPSCAMELPSDDDGASLAQMELPASISQGRPRSLARRRRGPASRGDDPPALLPSDDDGHTSDTTLQLGLPRSLASIAKRKRRGPAPRGDHPRDVIPGPSAGASLAAGGPRGDHPRGVIPGSSAGDALGAGDIDLPEEVANDELDDLFVDVTTASPKKEDRSLAKTLRGHRLRHVRVFPGPTPRPQWCTSVLLMWRLTWAAPLVVPYRTMSWRCSRLRWLDRFA